MKRIVLILAIVSLTGCTQAVQEQLSNTATVEYRVSGTSDSVSVTYRNETGGTSQEDISASSGWSHSFTGKKGDTFMYISAMDMTGKSGALIIVNILVNGTVQKASTGKGGYCFASASAGLK